MTNPPPGTLISDTVTDGDRDFYIVSQKTDKGIATPTHYYVLENDLANSNDPSSNKQVMMAIQHLCYKQCYMYFNWLGSIKVPAPVQYAHKLSNLVGDKF